MPADLPAPVPVLRSVLALKRWWTVALALSVAAGTACSLLLPRALARAIDRTLAGAGLEASTPLLVLIVVAAAAEATAQCTAPGGAAATGAALRSEAIRRVGAAGPGTVGAGTVGPGTVGAGTVGPGAIGTGTVGGPTAGDLTARLTGSAPQAALAGAAVVHTVAQLLTAAGALTCLFLLSPGPAVAFLLAAPVGWLLVRRQVRRTAGHGEAYLAAQSEIASRLVEAVRGSASIAAAGARSVELARVLLPLPDLSRHGHALWRSQRETAWKVGLLAPATQVAVLAAAGADLAAGRLTPGGLAAAMAYTTVGLGGFGAAQSLLDLARARAAAVRLAELRVPAPVAGNSQLPWGKGQLEFQQVAIRSGSGLLLNHLDLTVPAGSWVAVVGADDAATSALAALAAGLLRPERGTVRLDGADLATVRPPQLRAAVAVAFADPVLYGATLADALTLGQQDVSEGKLVAAARTVGADAFLRRLPSGYRTPPAQAPLSGGERQRVGLARALCRDARLLVLDHATASLDASAESLVLAALRTHAADRTRLCATRSAALAAEADLVAWLDRGRVRKLAAHGELWSSPGYRALFGAAA
ncbi:ATP-binding cassette domain-containing protein [Kitasatospora sp. NPDC059673]|uniref:ATP-binding cassette domain-containing protein n=1 Tax=Kitasatospora sp. NPDC059673 TaxID=3346901 RepID=UPI00368EB493